MKCPIDQTELSMSDRQGIEIDYCPQCRGVWLDRGELDKIIERSGVATAEPPARPQAAYQEPRSYERDTRGHSDDRRYEKKHKKENFLGDLFDF